MLDKFVKLASMPENVIKKYDKQVPIELKKFGKRMDLVHLLVVI